MLAVSGVKVRSACCAAREKVSVTEGAKEMASPPQVHPDAGRDNWETVERVCIWQCLAISLNA